MKGSFEGSKSVLGVLLYPLSNCQSFIADICQAKDSFAEAVSAESLMRTSGSIHYISPGVKKNECKATGCLHAHLQDQFTPRPFLHWRDIRACRLTV